MDKTVALANMLYVSRSNGAWKKKTAEGLDIPPGEFSLLAYVCRNPGCRQECLMEELGFDKTRITHMLNHLEELGYICREQSEEDARRKVISPTGKGRELHPLIHECFVGFRERVFEGLSEEEVAELVRLTAIVKANAKEIVKELK